MKLSLMRPALVLALALGLASCGGKAGFTVGGSITGLTQPGLVLTTNGMELAVTPPPATQTTPASFAFAKEIEYGDVYEVKIKTQPAHQVCSVVLPVAEETAGRHEKINVQIQCKPLMNKVSGTITGLTASGLVLANGSTVATVAPAANATAFEFPAIPYGQTYGITIVSQPVKAQPTDPTVTCVVMNGVGTMDDVAVTNVKVECTSTT